MPFFRARVASFWGFDRTIFHVYVASDELLFLSLGYTSLDPKQAADSSRAVGFMLGGMLGGAIGGAIGETYVEQRRQALAELMRTLDAADEDALRQLVEQVEKSFTLSLDDLQGLRIDPYSIWTGLQYGFDHHGIAQFTHVDRGKMTLELLALEDVMAAARVLPEHFAGDAEVNVSWNSY